MAPLFFHRLVEGSRSFHMEMSILQRKKKNIQRTVINHPLFRSEESQRNSEWPCIELESPQEFI